MSLRSFLQQGILACRCMVRYDVIAIGDQGTAGRQSE
jgi:hypothetical protein